MLASTTLLTLYIFYWYFHPLGPQSLTSPEVPPGLGEGIALIPGIPWPHRHPCTSPAAAESGNGGASPSGSSGGSRWPCTQWWWRWDAVWCRHHTTAPASHGKDSYRRGNQLVLPLSLHTSYKGVREERDWPRIYIRWSITIVSLSFSCYHKPPKSLVCGGKQGFRAYQLK